MTDDELTVLEAAEKLRVSKGTVFSLIHRGDLITRRKTLRRTSPLLISKASLDAYQERLTRKSERQPDA